MSAECNTFTVKQQRSLNVFYQNLIGTTLSVFLIITWSYIACFLSTFELSMPGVYHITQEIT